MFTTSTPTPPAPIEIETYEVVAEDAPIGVLMWPVRTPDRAPNYTIAEVSTHRRADETWVQWLYESGTTRTFKLGQKVCCGRIPGEGS